MCYSLFHSAPCHSAVLIGNAKNCAFLHSIYFLTLYLGNICQIANFVALQWGQKSVTFWQCNQDIMAELSIIWIRTKSHLLTTQKYYLLAIFSMNFMIMELYLLWKPYPYIFRLNVVHVLISAQCLRNLNNQILHIMRW